MNKKIKITACALCASMVLSSFTIATTAANATPAPVKFDDANIVLSFGAMSDIHQNGSTNSDPEQKFAKALATLNKKTNNNLDAFLVAGDLTDNASDAQINQFKRVFQTGTAGNDTKLIYSLGNHDSSGGSNAKRFHDIFGDSIFEADIDKDQIDKGNRFVNVGGYYFITVEVQGYGGSEKCYYSEATKKWLEEKLAFCNKQDKNKPVFIATHAMIYDTAYGSTLPGDGPAWYTKQLTPILNKYPQAVTFSGHVHHPLNDERSIMQTGFTSLGCGSGRYMAIESGYTDMPSSTSTVPTDANNFSQGLLVQVDKNNNVKFTRMDFFNNRECGQPWIIPGSSNDGSHLKYYAKDRAQTNSPPAFASDSNIKATLKGRDLTVNVDSATDDQMVHHYRAEVKIKGSNDKPMVLNTLSGFYRTTMPTKFTFNFKRLILGEIYEVKIFAVDSWNAESVPATITVAVPSGPINPALLVPDIFNLAFENNLAKDSSASAYPITAGAQEKIIDDKSIGQSAYIFDGTTDSAAQFIISDAHETNLCKKFTADVVFKVGKFTSEDQHILSNNVTGGFAFMIPANSQKLSFYLMVNNQKKYLETKEDIKLGQYYRATVTYDGIELAMYLNGEIQEIAAQSGSLSVPKGDKNYFVLGAKPGKTGELSNAFNGTVAIARLFTTPLDRTHVKALPAPKFPDAPIYEFGDVTRNGVINTLDSLEILKNQVALITFDDEQMSLADYDQNGVVNTIDSLRILKMLVGIA